MMKNIVFRILLSLFIIQSCSKIKKNEEMPELYCGIIFESNRKVLWINNDIENSTLENDVRQKNGEFKTIKKEIVFTQNEKDSIYKYAYRIITKPAISDKVLTCGAGENIKIKIRYCGTILSIQYSSLQNWSNLSNDTKKLYELLNNKTEIPK